MPDRADGDPGADYGLAEQAAPGPDSATPAVGALDDDRGTGSGEAARWRRKLRDVEAERDDLRARLVAVQRAEVERIAADGLADPADLWLGGDVDLAVLLAEDGTVDPDKVAEHVAALVERRPHWAPRPPTLTPDLDQGQRGGATAAAPRFADFLRDART